MKKSVLSTEQIKEMKEIGFKIIAEEMVREEMKRIENEFPEIEDMELFDMVYELTFCNYKYHAMNDADKFDYLVDEIIEMIMEKSISDMEKQTNEECR